jgi:prepilin-type N-terminal cleavage/methylation domain-containing protein
MRNKGFTIIELLVSITIILLLIGAASVGIYNARRTSRDTRRVGDIFLYAHAIDAYASINNNSFPVKKSTLPAGNKIMCAHEIGGIDSSLLSNPSSPKVLPMDPKPTIQPSDTTSCPDAQYGYVYHTEYGHNATAPYSSIANAQNVTYSLEVALENIKPFDESQLRAPSELLDASNVNNVSSSYSDLLGNRHRYILNGSYCVNKDLCYK